MLTSSTIKSSDGKGLGSGEQRDMTSCDITVMYSVAKILAMSAYVFIAQKLVSYLHV